jgi:hypothetical protein
VIPPDQIVLSLPLAHATHWYFIPLYVAPVLLILISALRTALKERRKAREAESGPAKPR